MQIDILYCGVCHSDLHTARNEWAGTTYPAVPGHEIVGRVTRVGDQVTKFKVGDLAAVGCLVYSCGICESCKQGLEQYCYTELGGTYNSPDKTRGHTEPSSASATSASSESSAASGAPVSAVSAEASPTESDDEPDSEPSEEPPDPDPDETELDRLEPAEPPESVLRQTHCGVDPPDARARRPTRPARAPTRPIWLE